MDGEVDWITARFLLATILGRHPLVVDGADDEHFPIDRSPRRAAPSVAVIVPPAAEASEQEEGAVCTICTEEVAPREAVMRLPCSHCFHAACISTWLGIRSNCPTCRRELPREGDAAGGGMGRARARPPPAGAVGGHLQREGSQRVLAGVLSS